MLSVREISWCNLIRTTRNNCLIFHHRPSPCWVFTFKVQAFSPCLQGQNQFCSLSSLFLRYDPIISLLHQGCLCHLWPIWISASHLHICYWGGSLHTLCWGGFSLCELSGYTLAKTLTLKMLKAWKLFTWVNCSKQPVSFLCNVSKVSVDRNWAAGSITRSLDQSERFWYCSSKHIMHFRRVTPGKKYQYLKSVCLLVHCG